MSGGAVERQFSQEQAQYLGREWVQSINALAAELTGHVYPHLPNTLRRGKQRSMLIVGCGGRGPYEVAAVGLALGPATITAVDIDTSYVELSREYWMEIENFHGNYLPEQLRTSTVRFTQADVFAHAPAAPYDVVLAYGIHPRDVVDAQRRGKRGVDAVIDLAKENGGIVVFTKKSLEVNKRRLEQELARRKQEQGDIDIVEEAFLAQRDYRTFVDDQYMWVVQRHPPASPTRRVVRKSPL